MAYTGRGTLPTIGGFGGRMNPTRFNDQSIADAFGKALGSSGAQRLQAGQFFTGEGGTQYKTVAGVDPNQPGWGNKIEPGYELVGYQNPEMYTGRQRQLYGSTPKTPGFAILRKKEEPKPAPAAAAPPPPPPAPAPAPTPTPEPVVDPGPSASDLAIEKLNDTIASLTSGFQTQLADQAAAFDKIRQEQEQRMTGLQNMFIAQQQQRDRPTVAGVKTATGQSGDAMQIARRGVSGAFGRRGMRIQSLNV